MALSNSQLADKISALVDRWNLREDEMIDWINGVVGGGPNGDGTYPITDGQDVTTYVTCPAQLEDDVESTTDSAKAYRDKAQQWAEESEDIEVETGAFSALHHAAKADASASAAATSESNAATSESNAANSASAASTSETNASDSETAAANSEVNASDSATVSQEWADTAEDTLVPSGNGTDDYSALHHAAKAEQSATSAATSESNAATSETNAQATLDEFEGTFYGALSSDPTSDPNGDSPDVGDLYFNTSDNQLKVYNGTSWNGPLLGNPGTAGNLAEWNADGDATDSGVASSAVLQDSDLAANGGSVPETDQNVTITGRYSFESDSSLVVASNIGAGDMSSAEANVRGVLTRNKRAAGDDQLLFSNNIDANNNENLTYWEIVTRGPAPGNTNWNMTSGIDAPALYDNGERVLDDADKTGADAGVVSGTSGVSGNLAEWNADGDATDSGVASSEVFSSATYDLQFTQNGILVREER